MKIFSQLVIVVIIIGGIFIFKNGFDYDSVSSSVMSYLEEGVDKYSSLYKDKIGEVVNSFKEGIKNGVDVSSLGFTNNSTEKQEADTPGALNVSDKYLTHNLKSIKLSSKEIIDITNEYRKSSGLLVELKENSKLDDSAEKKLDDMFDNQYFEHISPSKIGVEDLGEEVGYEYILIGENLALGNFKDNQALVDAWMDSPGHKANILNKRYTEIGVAVSKGTYQGESVWMAVQHFGLPKTECPSIDEVLKDVITSDQKKVKSLESDLLYKKSQIEGGIESGQDGVSDKIDTYNNMVTDYNNIFNEIKNKINKYNEQVKAFNSCIAGSSN